jgi:5-oxopent-3-ene-1,2,5-tricarboxylate decarboxylase/2-hydroxyhepta-2,4-diene-1,7-dioate isomerase
MKSARIIAGGRQIIASLIEGNRLVGPDGTNYAQDKVVWLPPVSPSKIVGLVLNYSDHAGELGLAPSQEPVLLLKPPNTLIGHLGKIIYPREATYMHYEAELAVVISRQARRIARERASDYILGYTIANDVTVRDFITNTFRPPVRAKGFDTFLPLGPFVVSQDEAGNVSNLQIKTLVNGEIRQEGNTRDMIHSIPELIEYITSFMTLEREDVILTGTPKGISKVGPGDRIQISIGNLGILENSVVAEGQN